VNWRGVSVKSLQCEWEDLMLRRVNAALFEAPAGARIELVAESRNNNGVLDARFEYAGAVLPRETISGLPGCSFTVNRTSGRLQAVVAFDPGAPGNARYDLSEVENGVLSNLGKFTLKSDSSPLLDFVIDPVAAPLGMAPVTPGGSALAAPTAVAPAPAEKRAAAKKRAAPREEQSAKPAGKGSKKRPSKKATAPKAEKPRRRTAGKH
jgi:hypothetical protein